MRAINFALICVTEEGRTLRTVEFNDVLIHYPADFVERLIIKGLPHELKDANWNLAFQLFQLDKNKSFSDYVLSTTGDDLYVGASTYSMFAAIGAAALKEFEQLESVTVC